MTKKSQLILLSLVLGIGLYLFVKMFLIEPQRREISDHYAPAITTLSSAAKSDPLQFLAAVSNAEIIVPGELNPSDPEGLLRAQLKNNQAEFVDSGSRGTVFLGQILKTQRTSSGVDIFCELVVSYGGSGNFHFVTLFKFSGGVLLNTSSASIGDRIKILDLKPDLVVDNSYLVTVDYLDRAESEPMATEPTIKKSLIFSVVNHRLKQ